MGHIHPEVLSKSYTHWASVAHAYNPSYSRRQRSGGSQFETNLSKQFMRPYLEKPHHKKKGLVEWLNIGPEFKP
jgi:hypothetical protein